MRRRDAQRLDVLPERIHVVHHDSDVDPAGSCWCIRILGQEQSLAIPMDDGETACPPKQFKPERTVKRDRALEVRTDDLDDALGVAFTRRQPIGIRSEEHTSEIPSPMRITY